MRRGFWFRFAEAILRPALWMFTSTESRGYDHVPRSGPAILVVNHLSYADPLVVARYVYDRPREVRFLGKSSLFTLPVAGWLLRRLGQIPVYRATRDAGRALEAAVERIGQGEAPIIYPEGTCTKDPDFWPMQGKTGAARLWFATGAPVVPVVNWGAQRLHDPQTRRLRLRPRTPIVVAAGPPVDLSAFAGLEPTAETLRGVTDVIMRRLRADLAAVRGVPVPQGPLRGAGGDSAACPNDSGRADGPRATPARTLAPPTLAPPTLAPPATGLTEEVAP